MRVLIVTNMYPTRERPEFGVFVREQLEALSRLEGVQTELYVIEGGGMNAYRKAVRPLRKHLRTRQYDIVHAHYGLTGWVARRAKATPLVVTYHGTDLRHEKVGKWSKRLARRIDQAAVVSDDLGRELAAVKKLRRPVAVLPTGVNLDRFAQSDRQAARRTLGIDPEGSFVLFPADPSRPEKRFDRAQELASTVGDVELLTLGGVPPTEVSTYINASDAVIVPSEHEGFGLATIEALACNVPVIATKTGIAPIALERVRGCYCMDFDLRSWHATLSAILDDPDPRIAGRETAARYSTDAMAKRVLSVYRDILDDSAVSQR
ncbi:MAG: glycosyltransferase [Solirubrobacterales bacterium]